MGFIETRRAAQGNSFRQVELFRLLPGHDGRAGNFPGVL
jgi:hypothetical protein